MSECQKDVIIIEIRNNKTTYPIQHHGESDSTKDNG